MIIWKTKVNTKKVVTIIAVLIAIALAAYFGYVALSDSPEHELQKCRDANVSEITKENGLQATSKVYECMIQKNYIPGIERDTWEKKKPKTK